jgi:hypothetical protein
LSSIASLADVKAHLRYPSPTQASTDDAIIQGLIDAATGVISYHLDDVLPTRHSETYSGGDCTVWLRHKPVISVSNVEESWGYIAYQLDLQAADSPAPFSMFAFSLDNPETGQITRRSAGNVVIPFRAGVDNIRVDYTSGREVVPPQIVFAVKSLVAHWFQHEELRTQAAGAADMQYDMVSQSFAFSRETGTTTAYYGVPNRILELIMSERRGPIIA